MGQSVSSRVRRLAESGVAVGTGSGRRYAQSQVVGAIKRVSALRRSSGAITAAEVRSALGIRNGDQRIVNAIASNTNTIKGINQRLRNVPSSRPSRSSDLLTRKRKLNSENIALVARLMPMRSSGK